MKTPQEVADEINKLLSDNNLQIGTSHHPIKIYISKKGLKMLKPGVDTVILMEH